uniref:Putative ovule protein n=1 Tax=Solanum chacoense TaxID=4108 RepID=A0A0V0GRJ8_SOLCH
MVDNQVDPILTSSTSTARMDFSSPFYLHPSENAGSSLLLGVLMALVIDHRGELFLEPYLLRVKQVLSMEK